MMSEIVSSSREKISVVKLYDLGESPTIKSCLKPGGRTDVTAGGGENAAASKVATGKKRVRFDL